MKYKTLKDCFWLWGQNPGSHHDPRVHKNWGLPGTNRLGPVECAEQFGISNICRVVMLGKPEPPFYEESEKMNGMQQVVWSAIGSGGSKRDKKLGDIEEVLCQAQKYSNVTGAIADDFFRQSDNSNPDWAHASVEDVSAMRSHLKSFTKRDLDFWVVWYKQQLHWDVSKYLELFDVITYWNMWAPAEITDIECDFATVVSKTPGKKRMAGFYMWNYGEGKPLSISEARVQCETYYNWIKQGKAHGIIFCSNCCADLGLKAVDWVKDWIREVGDEPVQIDTA